MRALAPAPPRRARRGARDGAPPPAPRPVHYPYIGVPRHIVEERMQPFHLRAIERGGGAAVSAADFYAFQQRQGAWGRDAA